MYWHALKPVAISGNTSRPSFFGSSVQQSQGFHAMLGSSDSMAMTPEDWYRRAKESVAKFDDLVSRVGRIADQAQRKNIQEWVGSTIVQDTPAYFHQQVLTDLRNDVELFIPAAVNAYQVESRTKKIEKLETINRDLDAMVTNAAASYGVLPSGQGVVNPPAPEPSSWLLPVVVGAGALGIAALVTYVYGGRA